MTECGLDRAMHKFPLGGPSLWWSKASAGPCFIFPPAVTTCALEPCIPKIARPFGWALGEEGRGPGATTSLLNLLSGPTEGRMTYCRISITTPCRSFLLPFSPS